MMLSATKTVLNKRADRCGAAEQTVFEAIVVNALKEIAGDRHDQPIRLLRLFWHAPIMPPALLHVNVTGVQFES
jgi:tRNA(Arg) A34 adenosine deaminase TadA